MKTLLLAILITGASLQQVSAASRLGGGQDGNGGDPLESEFVLIANNIAAWIKIDGSENLELPRGVTQSLYRQSMLKVLGGYHIGFTQGKVLVSGTEKTCRNWKDKRNENQILCNSERFDRADADSRYQLVHHEFAGLAGLERSQNQDSDYRISSQISSYLQNEVVRRLPVVQQEVDTMGLSPGIRRITAGRSQFYLPGTCESQNYEVLFARIARGYVNAYKSELAPLGIVKTAIATAVGLKSTYIEGRYTVWVIQAKMDIQFTAQDGTLLDLKLRAPYPQFKEAGYAVKTNNYVEVKTDKLGNIISRNNICVLMADAYPKLINHKYQTEVEVSPSFGHLVGIDI